MPARRVVEWPVEASDLERAAAALLARAAGSESADPCFAFAAYLAWLRERGEVLVIVVHDLDALPADAARWLRATLDSSGGSLRVVAEASSPLAAERATARLGLALRVARPSRARVPAPSPQGATWRWLWLPAALAALAALLVGRA